MMCGCRFLAGLSQAFPSVFLPVWVDEFSPPGKSAKWMAYTQLASISGTVLGNLVGGIVTRLSPSKKGSLQFFKPLWTTAFLIQLAALLPTLILTAFADHSTIDVQQDGDEVKESSKIFVFPPSSGSGSQLVRKRSIIE